MLSIIRTDLVLIPKPKVIKDYLDIVDREVGRINIPFFKGTPEAEFFKNALDGSPGHEVWEQALVVERYDEPGYFKELYDQKKMVFLKNIESYQLYFITRHEHCKHLSSIATPCDTF